MGACGPGGKDMAVRIGRKGIFFTIISIMLVLIILVLFLGKNSLVLRERQQSVETRISTMNDFLKDFYNDAQRAVYISTFRSFIAMEDHLSRSGNYVNDTEDMFRVVFMTGEINGTSQEVMKDSTFLDYQEKVNRIANRIDINMTVNVTDVRIEQDSPWTLNVSMDLDVIVRDRRNLASWYDNKTLVTTVSIIELRDPLFAIGTQGRLPQTIVMSPFTDFVDNSNPGVNDSTNLELFLNNSYYINSTRAPSFLMRFEGNLSPSPYGIESFVDLPDLSAQGMAVGTNRSVVDFIYFSGAENTASACDIQNMPEWFKLDAASIPIYEIDKLTSGSCT